MKMKKLVALMLMLAVCATTLLSFDASVALAKPNKGKPKLDKVTVTMKTFAETEETEALEDEEPVEDVELEEDADLEDIEEGEKPVKVAKEMKLKKSPSAIANQLIKEMGIKRNVNGVNLIALLNESLATDPLLQTAVPADLEAYNTMVVEFIRAQHELRMTLEPVITLE
jgi:hypothetical protein